MSFRSCFSRSRVVLYPLAWLLPVGALWAQFVGWTAVVVGFVLGAGSALSICRLIWPKRRPPLNAFGLGPTVMNSEQKAMIRSVVAVASIGVVLLLGLGSTAESAEITVLCANGMQTVMEDLAPKFERATGHKLRITFATGGETVKRAGSGEPVDLVIAPHRGIDGLVKDGKVAADAVTAIASTGISVAVRKGAPRPDISSPEALKRALLASQSITYLNPADGGASGIHFAKVLDRLGIANEMKSKTVLAPKAGAVGAFVANGEAEIGVIQHQLLLSVPGIEIVGPLPGDLQDTTVFSGATMGGAGGAEAARTLITFLRSPEAAAVIKAKGMNPGAP